MAALTISALSAVGTAGPVPVTIDLCDLEGDHVSGYSAAGVVVERWSGTTDEDGELSVDLTPNDDLTPANTLYLVTVSGRVFLVDKAAGTQALEDALATVPEALGPLIDVVTAAQLAAEAAARAAADAELTGDLDDLADDLTDEVLARTAGDIAEAAVRTAGLLTEATARAGADSAEAAIRALADTTEATARATADGLLIPLTQKGAASGVATLDGAGTVPDAQLPTTIARDSELADVTAAVSAHEGDVTAAHGASAIAITPWDGNISAVNVNDALMELDEEKAPHSAITTHSADTTAVHGIPNTAALVVTTDGRLTDARTPTAHAATHIGGGTDPIAAAIAAGAAGLMSGADKTKLDGIEAGATADQTAAEILTAVKTVDGPASGLDADTLDGIEGAALVPKALVDAKGDLVTATGNDTPSRKAVGASGDALVSNPNDADGLRWSRMSFSLVRAGCYSSPSAGAYTASAYTANRVHYTPFFIPRRLTFDRMGVHHTATVAGAGSVARLGIYAAVADIPADLIVEPATQIDLTTAAAFKVVTVAVTLEPGLVFLACSVQWVTTSPSLASLTNAALRVPDSTLVTGGGYFENGAAGPLPLTAAPSTSAVSQPPLVYIRAA